eukprot:TRINITY_DN1984_c0_g1_i1.p1 TRINITY_DN1984_c0_g1~~TRINITY_DN1984_c0_g1_i1.p1  ORF type:complete len:248 (+),score=103.08 TRINITY_DN1984_c0_g1_i1:55-744(+)
MLYVYVAVLVLFVLFFVRKFLKKAAGGPVLLVGMPGAGKTAFLIKAVTGTDPETHTSMQPNRAELPSDTAPKGRGGSVPLVDLPGHMRLRPLLAEHLPKARGVAVFIDSVDLAEAVTGTAELLYSLLTNYKQVVARGLPILIVCNKRELETAFKPAVVKTRLEKELNVLKDTRKNDVVDLGAADHDEVVPLTAGTEAFTFERAAVPVAVCACSVHEGDILDPIAWMWGL